MELFTLGVGAYSEADIKAGARALTGWTVDRATGEAALAPRRHDGKDKTILGATGPFDADTFAELLVGQPAHARFLSGRLWARFASGDPVAPATADRLVAAYGQHRSVDGMLRALFLDDAFGAARGQLVKQPVEWAVGAIRQLRISPGAAGSKGLKRQRISGGLRALGQLPLRPPSVGGWPAGTAWLTTSSALERLQLAVALANAAHESVLGALDSAGAASAADALAHTLAVDGWTDRTRAAFTEAGGNPRRLLAVALASPEYAVM
jgi:uncharacterized protein (DUF1800 family)